MRQITFETFPNLFHAVGGKSIEEQIVNTCVHNLECSQGHRSLSETYRL